MNYNPFNKKDLSELSIEDIKTLISREIGEGWHIEYKRGVPKLKSNKFDNLKIAKSISSFANTKGGWIFWGIESDNKNKPTLINGFDISEYRNFEDQISQTINANISPKPYYHLKKIDLENGNIVLVIKVDESPTPPYITSQGVIYQRENNESKPIKDRYIIEKLNEKTEEYYESIERFSNFDLEETRGQSDSHQTYLELYLFPIPFNNFKFKRFYTSDFFNNVAKIFYKNINVNIGNASNVISLNLGFNSIYSSEGSLIIRPLKEHNLIYKSTTVELFKNGNLKFLIPLYEFNSENAPDRFKNSNTLNYILNKYSPNKSEEQESYGSCYAMPKHQTNNNISLITKQAEKDFVNHIKFIDGMELILNILIIVSKYKAVLDNNEFDFSNKIGFRAKITDFWRKFVFFDNDDYLEKLKLYNIPLSPKNKIEIPDFKNGKSHYIMLSEDEAYMQIARFILEGIGLPDSQTINFDEIIKNGLERFKSKNGS